MLHAELARILSAQRRYTDALTEAKKEVDIDPIERGADQRFVSRLEVVLRGVEPVDPRRDSSLDHVDRAINVRLFIRLRSKLETAETDARDRDTARAKWTQLHRGTGGETIRRFQGARERSSVRNYEVLLSRQRAMELAGLEPATLLGAKS